MCVERRGRGLQHLVEGSRIRSAQCLSGTVLGTFLELGPTWNARFPTELGNANVNVNRGYTDSGHWEEKCCLCRNDLPDGCSKLE